MLTGAPQSIMSPAVFLQCQGPQATGSVGWTCTSMKASGSFRGGAEKSQLECKASRTELDSSLVTLLHKVLIGALTVASCPLQRFLSIQRHPVLPAGLGRAVPDHVVRLRRRRTLHYSGADQPGVLCVLAAVSACSSTAQRFMADCADAGLALSLSIWHVCMLL